MAKRSAYDFRRWRHKLYNWQFAMPGTREKPPPERRVDKDTWDDITHLPDDVSLRTSDYHGRELRIAHNNIAKWWDLFGDIPENDPVLFPLQHSSVNAYFECDASLFNALVGYYRQAGASLRYILEALLSGICFSATPNRRLEFGRHRAGDPSIMVPTIGQIRNEISELDNFKNFNAWLAKRNEQGFLNRKPDGFVITLYDELTEFSHGRTARKNSQGEVLAYSNVDIWESNGPIYVQEQFLRWYDLLGASLFCSGALSRIYLLSSTSVTKAYLSAYRVLEGLKISDGARNRVAPFIDFLAEVVGN